MWTDETYRIFVLEENGPVKELPIEAGKQRFLILARPAKPLQPDLDYQGTDLMLERIRDKYGAIVHRLVEDVAGYSILINVENHDQIREVLKPLPDYDLRQLPDFPRGTLSGHRRHIQELRSKRSVPRTLSYSAANSPCEEGTPAHLSGFRQEPDFTGATND